MDFEVVDVQKGFVVLDALLSTLVDLGDTVASYRAVPKAAARLNNIAESLRHARKVGVTKAGARYMVYPWINEFASEMASGKEGLKVTYTVHLSRDSFDLADFLEVEGAIYELIEETEAMMKGEFHYIQELVGKLARFI
jgi:hypothetical protein